MTVESPCITDRKSASLGQFLTRVRKVGVIKIERRPGAMNLRMSRTFLCLLVIWMSASFYTKVVTMFQTQENFCWIALGLSPIAWSVWNSRVVTNLATFNDSSNISHLIS
jgi:hypothetical protein